MIEVNAGKPLPTEEEEDGTARSTAIHSRLQNVLGANAHDSSLAHHKHTLVYLEVSVMVSRA